MKKVVIGLCCLMMGLAPLAVASEDEAPEAKQSEQAMAQNMNDFLPAEMEGWESGGVSAVELGDLLDMESEAGPMEVAAVKFTKSSEEGDPALIKAAVLQGKALQPVIQLLGNMKVDVEKPGKKIETVEVGGHEGMFVVKANEDGTLQKAVFLAVVENQALVIVKGTGPVDPDDVMAVAEKVDFDGIVAALK